MTYAFVDTNIFIRIATQGRPGCEPNHFNDLQTLVTGDEFQLILPEVVSLEVEKGLGTLPKLVESACDKLSEAVSKATQDTWSEIDSLKVDVLSRINKLKQSRIKQCLEMSTQIKTFLKSNVIMNIPLTPEILVAAKRRLIVGKMPNSRKSSDQDALIIESLVSYFRTGSRDSVNGLLFCTENTSDFAIEVKGSGLERRFVLDPKIQADLPSTRFSTDLASMLTVVRGFEDLPAPSGAEIEHAKNMRDLHDIDDEEFGIFHELLTETVNKESVKQFEEKLLPSIPDEIRNVRRRLSQTIRELLMACRQCRSWSDRSEGKLMQWIEYVDEKMIPYTSLPKMIRIKNSLESFLEIHKEMSRELEETM